MIVVNVTKATLFKQYLLWLDPIFNLTIVEREIMAALLTLHYNHQGIDNLNELLFSDKTLTIIRKKLRLGKKVFEEGFKRLNERGYISNGSIASSFTQYPTDGKFALNIEFKYGEGSTL